MKPWISIATVIGVAVVAVLGMMIYRSMSAGTQVEGQVRLYGELAGRGLEVATAQGCIACHSLDGKEGIGPTWLGMYGREQRMTSGETVIVDEHYIRESIMEPGAKVVEGFDNVMIRYFLSPQDIDALVEFTRQLVRKE